MTTVEQESIRLAVDETFIPRVRALLATLERLECVGKGKWAPGPNAQFRLADGSAPDNRAGKKKPKVPAKTQRRVYRPSDERIADLQRRAEGYVRAWAEKNGVTFDGALEKARALMDEAAAGPIKINTTVETAQEILDDGRFETQFESGTSGGNYDPEVRADGEFAGLGIPRDLDPALRPVYGYTEGAARQYGEIQWVLKDSVKERATITLGDSLGGFLEEAYDRPDQGTGLIGTPLLAPGLEGFHGEWRTDLMMRRGLSSVPFVEAQIQGGVTLDDVQEVRVSALGYGGWTGEHEALLNRLIDLGIDAYMETE